MENRRDKSVQEWEQEIRARQQNVTPADYPEGLHYARIEGLPKIISQWRFWLGVVLAAVGLSILRSTFLAGIGTVACGIVLAITAMRWSDKL